MNAPRAWSWSSRAWRCASERESATGGGAQRGGRPRPGGGRRGAASGWGGGSGAGPQQRGGQAAVFLGATASTTLIAKSFCVLSSSSARPKLDSTTAFGFGSCSTKGSASSSGIVNALPAKSSQRLMPLNASSWLCFTPAMKASAKTEVGSEVLVVVVGIAAPVGGVQGG